MYSGTGENDRTWWMARADEFIGQGEFEQAYQAYLRAIERSPSDPQLRYLAGIAAWRALRPAESGKLLSEAARLAPHHPAPHHALADWCANSGNITGALEHSARAMSIAPGEPEVRASRATALAVSGAHGEAWAILKELCECSYVPPRAYVLRGRLATDFGDESNSLDLILAALDRPDGGASERASLHFAAARLLENLGRYERAYEQATMAHAHRRLPHDPEWLRRKVDREVSHCTPSRLHDLPRASHGSRRPVFILGMPRSGTTLVEQILASHPDVYGAGELALVPQIAGLAGRLGPNGRGEYPLCLDRLSLCACDELAERYLAEISKLNDTARYVTDKLPTNFLHLGIITLLFPDCHVVHCVRDPMDTCLSCYMTDFAIGNEFAQDLRHVGKYYVQYRRLMEHWQDTLNVPRVEVRYEQLVYDLEGATRELLETLDLPWDRRCLEFHRTRRHVASASSHQVRRPIYTDSVGRWRHYERHLGPLKEALGQYAECSEDVATV
jgi:tetratricopeptide (TPR) repeat protein